MERVRSVPPAKLPLSIALRGARLFRGVEASLVDALAESAHASSLCEAEPLWHAGQSAESFTVVVSGLVQVERYTVSGEAVIVALFGPSESVGDTAALRGAPYPADACAASKEVCLLRLPRAEVLAAMERHPSVAHAVHQALLEHVLALNAKIDVVCAGSVGARLATLLLQLAARFGDEDETGSLCIPLSLSRVALSRLVSARVETVIRTLAAWAKQGLVRTTPGGFQVASSGALEAIARAG